MEIRQRASVVITTQVARKRNPLFQIQRALILWHWKQQSRSTERIIQIMVVVRPTPAFLNVALSALKVSINKCNFPRVVLQMRRAFVVSDTGVAVKVREGCGGISYGGGTTLVIAGGCVGEVIRKPNVEEIYN
jgi:hypothetical protein